MSQHEITSRHPLLDENGHLIEVVDMNKIHSRPFREYNVGFFTKEDFESVDTSLVEVLNKDEKKLVYTIRLDLKKTEGMIRELEKHNIKFINEVQYTLEKYFMENVIGGTNDGNK